MNAHTTPASTREHSTADTSTTTAPRERLQHALATAKPAVNRRLTHPLAHVLGLIAAHTAALVVLEKTPLLALLSLH